MKLQLRSMPVIPAAGMLSAHPHARSNFQVIARFSGGIEPCSAMPKAREASHKSRGDWLNADEYFPIDADSFEER